MEKGERLVKTSVDHERLIAMQKYIYQLTRVRVAVYDSSFRLISFYPQPVQHTPTCHIIRSCKEGFHRCNLSDVYGMNSAKENKAMVTYKCHAGLVESVLPVISEGQILCYLLLGQYLDADASIEEQVQDILKNTLDFTELSVMDDTVRCLPVLSKTQCVAAFSLMMEIIRGQQIIKKEYDPVCELAEKYIVSHIEEDINIASLCKNLNLAPQRIRKHISEGMGMTVGNYIMALKIEKAQELLYSTDMSVSEIASAVGIPDFNYFSRVFKKKVGSTPMAFRKSNNGELALQLSKYELQNELMKDFERLSNAPSPQPLDGTEETR